MAKRQWLWAVVLALLPCAVGPAVGEDVAEAWRTPFGRPYLVSADGTDGTCWIVAGSAVVRVASDGTMLARRGGFTSPSSVATNPADGSCWVTDVGYWDGASYIGTGITHVSADGTVLWQGGTFDEPECVALNSTDGSVWVADPDRASGNGHVVHLAATGEELYRGDVPCPRSVSVDPADGSCWVSQFGLSDGVSYDPGVVTRLSEAGEVLWTSSEFTWPWSVSVDTKDGSCWVGDGGLWDGVTHVGSAVVHLSKTGDELWRGGGLNSPYFVSADSKDDSCWVSDYNNPLKGLVHLSAAGEELWSSPGWPTFGFHQISADPTDGSCWAIDGADYGADAVHVSATGTEIWRGKGLVSLTSVSVSPTDGSCWVADGGTGQVLHLAPDGETLWSGNTFDGPRSVSATTSDGSCWVADSSSDQVVHLSPDGDELWRSPPVFPYASAVSANPEDGSCWAAGGSGLDDIVAHLDEDGTELWYGHSFDVPVSLSVNPTDGSCWVGENQYGVVKHLSATGGAMAGATGFHHVRSVSVNPTDGSCWVASLGTGLYPNYGGKVTHLSEDGVVLWSSEPLFDPESVSVNPIDGSCWVGDGGRGEVLHFAEDGSILWRSSESSIAIGPESVCVDPKDGSCWVADAWHGEVVHLVKIIVTPTADFVAEPTAGAAPLEVAFIDRSPHTPTSWSWDFGDGGTDTIQNPTHTYTVPGSYTVSLTVTNAAGWDTASKPDYITVTVPPPAADFAAAPLIGPLPLAVTFTDTSAGEVSAWLWDFGDGGTATGQSPSHSYPKAGRYTVSLTVSNGGGSDAETKADYITVLFTDVAADYWACDEVMACVDAGIVAGYPNGTYAPATEVTRDQMAVYLARALAGGDAEVPAGPEAPSFADVPHSGFGDDGTDSYWAYKYIEYCAAHNVVLGYPGGDYKPTETVDRGQMAVYVARALVAPAGDAGLPYPPVAGSTFTDVTPDNEWRWCYQHVEYLAAEETVQGYWDGTYRPEETVTRDQMAVYVARAFELLP